MSGPAGCVPERDKSRSIEHGGSPSGDHAAARRVAAVAGHTGDAAAARALLADTSPAVRATALGGLARLGVLSEAEAGGALSDPSPVVRRRACELAVGLPGLDVRPALLDADTSVVEAAAWALGERGAADAVSELCRIAGAHDDPLCREAAVAALGAVGDAAGLPAILSALGDRPAVRRRAVIALAPFSGPDVDAALERARTDRDHQVRQAAEDLLGR